MTPLYQTFKNLFLKSEAAPAEPIETEEATPLTQVGNEVAISESSLLYGGKDFRKYNPDDLIGRKGFAVYKRMMQDEQVKAVINFKRDAISARGWCFKFEGDELSETERDYRINLFKEILREMPGSFLDSINGVLSAHKNGFSMSEIVTKHIEYDSKTWIGLQKVKVKPFDSFTFNVDDYGNVKEVIQEINGRHNKINLKKFIHYVVNPDNDEHYGGSELREVYRPWFTKDVAIKFRNIYLERYACGYRVAKPSEKSQKTITPGSADYTSVLNLLSNINLTSSLIIPAWLEVTTEYPKGDGSGAYKDAINDSDMQIARGLLVPPLLGVSPQGDTGSYSQSSTQLEAFFWTLQADTARLEECLNEQLFKPLGEVNFADGIAPYFSFNPLSKDKAIEIIRLFMELVKNKVLTSSDEDQLFIREILDLPLLIVEEEEEAETDDTGNVGDDTTDSTEDDEDKKSPSDQETEDDDKTKQGKEGDDDEETILGKGTLKNAVTRATKRVAFAIIEKTSEAVVEEHTANVAEITDAMAADLLAKAKEGGELDSNVAENFRNVKIDGKLKQKLQSEVNRTLKAGQAIGIRHASNELDRARQTFSAIDMKRIDFLAEDYFKTTSFKITGDLSDSIVKLIEQQILSGANNGKTWQEVEKDIYQLLASKGLISTETAKRELGSLLNATNPDARLRTIVSTSTFDAINNARFTYFTDPGLGDFVQAFEYSAILDSRTTSICRHLEDGAGDHSKAWYERNKRFKPPNHYNCRSLLIPITVVDMGEFVEGQEPSQFPQEGFG